MVFKNADLANSHGSQLWCKPWIIVTQLRMRVRVGSNRKGNPLLYRQLDDPIAWIKFVHRFAPSSSGKFGCEISRANKIQRFVDDRSDFGTGPMAMDLNKIEMSKAVD